MGSSASTGGAEAEPSTSVLGLGMGTIMRDIGMAMIPVHLKHSYQNILQIVETAMKLRQFDEAPYNNNLIMLIALLRNAQMQPLSSGPSVVFQGENVNVHGFAELASRGRDNRAKVRFEDDRVFGGYATNIYLASWKFTAEERAACMGVELEDVVFTWFKDDNDEHCPKFMILLDHERAAVVLVIRGTFCFKDALIDVVCEEAEFLDGFAHKGFMEGSRKVLDKSAKILEQSLVEHYGYSLVVCGHSMGGSVAVMITMELLRNNSVATVLPPGITARCVALGSAPVYRTEGGINTDYLDKITVYVNDKDVVPRLSLGSVAKLLAMLRAVDGVELSTEEQFGVVMWREDSVTVGNRERVVRAVKEVRQDRFLYLQHPGQLILLVNRGNTVEVKVQGEEDSIEIAANMEISETMISDHLHTVYKDTFAKLIYKPDNWEIF